VLSRLIEDVKASIEQMRLVDAFHPTASQRIRAIEIQQKRPLKVKD
jgi:hypothetical protein